MKKQVFVHIHKALILGKKNISYVITSSKSPYKNQETYVTLQYVNDEWHTQYHLTNTTSRNKNIPWKEIKKIIKQTNSDITEVEIIGKELIKE